MRDAQDVTRIHVLGNNFPLGDGSCLGTTIQLTDNRPGDAAPIRERWFGTLNDMFWVFPENGVNLGFVERLRVVTPGGVLYRVRLSTSALPDSELDARVRLSAINGGGSNGGFARGTATYKHIGEWCGWPPKEIGLLGGLPADLCASLQRCGGLSVEEVPTIVSGLSDSGPKRSEDARRTRPAAERAVYPRSEMCRSRSGSRLLIFVVTTRKHRSGLSRRPGSSVGTSRLLGSEPTQGSGNPCPCVEAAMALGTILGGPCLGASARLLTWRAGLRVCACCRWTRPVLVPAPKGVDATNCASKNGVAGNRRRPECQPTKMKRRCNARTTLTNVGDHTLNCFVIMPFTQEFDDVYDAIKTGVVGAAASADCRCFRLDETRPAGRITDRLLKELRTATLCVADLTGNRPNVMWEVGFAMALNCPTLLVTQALSELPFDIRDMQSLQYDRSRLGSTLSQPLQRMVVDTLSAQALRVPSDAGDRELVGELLAQVAELKTIVAQAVLSWSPPPEATKKTLPPADVRSLEGSWVNDESGSHMYARVVGTELVAPYCYQGNHKLTGAYYGWKKAGAYWFARFSWLSQSSSPPAGFAFLLHESVNLMHGAWWGNETNDDALPTPTVPPPHSGVEATWRRDSDLGVPKWAQSFFDEVQESGLPRGLSGQ